MDRATLERALDLGIRAAAAAAEGILGSFRSPALAVEHKADGSVVTEADRRAESTMRDVLRASSEFGRFQILGEEQGLEGADSPYRWVIDPIDGTQSFTRGIPTFGTIVALEEAATERALLGVIQLPALGDGFSAARGLGARWNGRPVRCAEARPLRGALVSAGGVRQFRRQGLDSSYSKLADACGNLRSYSDCWAHSLAIRGAVDALVELGLQVWDIRATQILIEEAGGKHVTLRHPDTGDYNAILGSVAVVDELAALLQFDVPAGSSGERAG